MYILSRAARAHSTQQHNEIELVSRLSEADRKRAILMNKYDVCICVRVSETRMCRQHCRIQQMRSGRKKCVKSAFVSISYEFDDDACRWSTDAESGERRAPASCLTNLFCLLLLIRRFNSREFIAGIFSLHFVESGSNCVPSLSVSVTHQQTFSAQQVTSHNNIVRRSSTKSSIGAVRC